MWFIVNIVRVSVTCNVTNVTNDVSTLFSSVRGVYPYLPMATNVPWSIFFFGGDQLKV